MIATTMNPVQAFLDKAHQDVQLRKQLDSLKTKETGKAFAEIVKIANKAGFKFTTKEYQEFARTQCQQKTQDKQPINDEQLISVACGCRS